MGKWFLHRLTSNISVGGHFRSIAGERLSSSRSSPHGSWPRSAEIRSLISHGVMYGLTKALRCLVLWLSWCSPDFEGGWTICIFKTSTAKVEAIIDKNARDLCRQRELDNIRGRLSGQRFFSPVIFHIHAYFQYLVRAHKLYKFVLGQLLRSMSRYSGRGPSSALCTATKLRVSSTGRELRVMHCG